MKEVKAESRVVGREAKAGAPAAGALTAIGSWPKQAKSFLEDVRSETKRVTWPTFKQIRATTVVVLLTVFFFGAYFGILDRLFSAAIGWLLRQGG